MCVNIDLGMGKTNEAVPTINITFDLSFSRLLLLECGGGPEKGLVVFHGARAAASYLGMAGCTECVPVPTNPTIETRILICRKY